MLQGHSDSVRAVAFSPDSQLIVPSMREKRGHKRLAYATQNVRVGRSIKTSSQHISLEARLPLMADRTAPEAAMSPQKEAERRKNIQHQGCTGRHRPNY